MTAILLPLLACVRSHEYMPIRQGEASTWMVEYSGVTLFTLIPTAAEFLAEADVTEILKCGLIPTFDRCVVAIRIWCAGPQCSK